MPFWLARIGLLSTNLTISAKRVEAQKGAMSGVGGKSGASPYRFSSPQTVVASDRQVARRRGSLACFFHNISFANDAGCSGQSRLACTNGQCPLLTQAVTIRETDVSLQRSSPVHWRSFDGRSNTGSYHMTWLATLRALLRLRGPPKSRNSAIF